MSKKSDIFAGSAPATRHTAKQKRHIGEGSVTGEGEIVFFGAYGMVAKYPEASTNFVKQRPVNTLRDDLYRE